MNLLIGNGKLETRAFTRCLMGMPTGGSNTAELRR